MYTTICEKVYIKLQALYFVLVTHMHVSFTTVKLLKKGHIGDGPVVPCREVVLFSEVFF